MSDTLVLKSFPQSIKQARDFVGCVAGRCGLDDYVPRLVVSELVTNAWRHAEGNDDIVVRAFPAQDAPAQLVIEVWDADPRPPVQCDPDDCDESGRGILLLTSVALRWGTRPSGGGKVVFAVVT
ncbi:ATP-binding protein [Actinomadura adrarensis]|uniref:ATP-binding protein n=1 Tax=Actinomadura adrarensis TaxID=1819600 RepID=A0ABW3C9M1_9ACTN